MDGISGASAAITVAQLGFSLATTLNTFVADVRNGRDDIANLANEIDATAIHVHELNQLIQNNSVTRGWNENGLKIANKCCTDCQDALNKLRRLFSKTGASLGNNTVSRNDIDLTLFDRLSWPFLKPQLAVLKQELQAIKIDILIALNTHKAHVCIDAVEKEAAAERVVALWRARMEAQRQVVLARNAPVDLGSRRVNFERPSRSRSGSGTRQRQMPRDTQAGPTNTRSAFVSSSDSNSPSASHQRGDAGQVPSQNISPTPNRIADDTADAASPVVLTKLVGPEVEDPKTEPLMAQILKAISKSKNDGNTMNSIMSALQIQPNEVKGLISALSASRSFRTKMSKTSYDIILQDPASRGGAAYTRAISLVKFSATEFRPYEVEYPIPLLAKRLRREKKTQNSGDEFSLQAWKNLPTLHPWCQQYVQEFLERGNKEKNFWTLLVADPIYKTKKSWRSRFQHKTLVNHDDLVHVLLVFKHCEKPKKKTSQTATEELFDACAEMYGEPLAELLKDKVEVAREVRRQKAEDRHARSRSRSSSRSSSRRRTRTRARSRARTGLSNLGLGNSERTDEYRPFPTPPNTSAEPRTQNERYNYENAAYENHPSQNNPYNTNYDYNGNPIIQQNGHTAAYPPNNANTYGYPTSQPDQYAPPSYPYSQPQTQHTYYGSNSHNPNLSQSQQYGTYWGGEPDDANNLPPGAAVAAENTTGENINYGIGTDPTKTDEELRREVMMHFTGLVGVEEGSRNGYTVPAEDLPSRSPTVEPD